MLVDREPDNTTMRLRLAWFLLGRALYRAGQDSKAADTSEESESVEDLLQSCLHHVIVIRQISLHAHERQEAQMICSLIGITGGSQWMQRSQDEENATLQRLVTSLRSPVERPSLPPHRHYRRQR
jgi:hypothetical protein